MTLVLRFHFANEIKVSAVLQCVEQRTPLRAVIGHKDSSRQVARIGIDGVAEERELKKRNTKHHREREAVPSHLQKSFRNDSAQTLKRKFRMPVHDAAFFLPSN